MAFLEIQEQLTRGVIQDELIKIVAATHQTIFMITHDVDEAILLAGRILLMSNGPRAHIAEIVENTIAAAARLQHDPQGPAVLPHPQSHGGFSGDRSRKFTESDKSDYDPKHPPVFTPSLDSRPAPAKIKSAEVINAFG